MSEISNSTARPDASITAAPRQSQSCPNTHPGSFRANTSPMGVRPGQSRLVTVTRVLIALMMALGFTGVASSSAMATVSAYTYASPSLNMRTDASLSASVIASIPYHATVTIDCVKYGPAVSNSYGTSTIWDHVTYGGKTGFVSDQWVWTGTSNPVAPLCSSAPAPASTSASAIQNYKAWALNSANWNGKTPYGYRGIDSDGAYGAQCADLGIAWSKWVGRRVGFDGYDRASANKPGWHVVGYTMAVARPGDVVTRVNGWQHVVVVTGNPSGGALQVIQQNPKSPHAINYGTSTSGIVWRLN